MTSPKPQNQMKKKMPPIALLLLVLLAFYILSAVVVFDFGNAAHPHDEEYFGKKQVAFGPAPRAWLCKPAYQAGFDGHEWPFFVYRPICAVWRTVKGYATPSAWRK
jgi:hypothetical protein